MQTGKADLSTSPVSLERDGFGRDDEGVGRVKMTVRLF
jgi:hypothetical protein